MAEYRLHGCPVPEYLLLACHYKSTSEVSWLSSWVSARVSDGLYLFGTPLCSSSSSSSSLRTLEQSGCSLRGNRVDGRYPSSIVSSNRTIPNYSGCLLSSQLFLTNWFSLAMTLERVVPSGSARRSTKKRFSIASPKKIRLPPLALTQRSFISFWLILVVVHALSAVFLVASGCVYWYLEHPYLSYYADLIAPVSKRYFKLIGVLLIALGTCNFLEFFGLIFTSIRAHCVAVPSVGILLKISCYVYNHAVACVKPSIRIRSLPQPTENRPRPMRPEFVARQVESIIGDSADLLSIESKQFDTVFSIREVVVIIAQIVQCYLFSSRIARPWINHVSVTLVVANCISSAVLYRLLRRYDRFIRRASLRITSFSGLSWHASPSFARLMCHVVDCLLTFAMSVLLPVAIFKPYADAYDRKHYTFPLQLLYSDTAFSNMIRENQALFARSLLDVGFKLVPHVSIYLCLIVIASVLRTRIEPPPTIPRARLVSLGVSPPMLTRANSTRKLQWNDHNQHHLAPSLSRPGSKQPATKQQLPVQLKQSAIAILFMILGMCIVALHLRATFSNSACAVDISSRLNDDNKINMCLQPVYPWFASGDSCAVVEYNCYRHNVDTPPSTMLHSLDANTVSVIIFSHCSALVVPSAIQSLSNLLGIEIYNSTIVEWSADAALLDTHHPHLVYLFFALVNMAELPLGVLQTPFPSRLGDIEFSHTNLTSFPASLRDVWTGVELIYLEHSLLTLIPVEIVSLPALSELSLIGNEITTLPDNFSNLIETDDFYFMALCSNPLTSLPSTVRSGLTFGFLSLENTQVSWLPSWVSARENDGLYLFGTPLCSSSSSSSSLSTLEQTGCSLRDNRVDGRYPFSLVSEGRSA